MESRSTVSTIENVGCGYSVFAHITGKSVDELRLESAEAAAENPAKFVEIQAASDWIRDRHPIEATSMLDVASGLLYVESSNNNIYVSKYSTV